MPMELTPKGRSFVILGTRGKQNGNRRNADGREFMGKEAPLTQFESPKRLKEPPQKKGRRRSMQPKECCGSRKNPTERGNQGWGMKQGKRACEKKGKTGKKELSPELKGRRDFFGRDQSPGPKGGRLNLRTYGREKQPEKKGSPRGGKGNLQKKGFSLSRKKKTPGKGSLNPYLQKRKRVASSKLAPREKKNFQKGNGF